MSLGTGPRLRRGGARRGVLVYHGGMTNSRGIIWVSGWLFTSVALAACGDAGGGPGTAGQGSSGSTGAGTGTGTGTTTGPGTGTGTTTEEPTGGQGQTASSGSGATTSGVSATSSGATTEATAGSSGGTTEGEVPSSCLDADFPVTAPLCGGPGPACVLKRDELVSDKPAFRNDAPALALRGDCGPAVLFSEAVGGYHGFFAERTGPGAWTVTATPMDVATGSLEHDPGKDEAIALVDDGAFGVTLWRRQGIDWTKQSGLAGMNHVRSLQMVRDAQDVLHVGHIDADQGLLSEVFDGAWTKDQIDKDAEIHVRIALAAGDEPRVVYWSSGQGTWALNFAAPPSAPETVSLLGSNVLERHHSSLALAAGDVPWVVFSRQQVDKQHHEVVLAHREGPDKWASETLAAEDPAKDVVCGEPDGPGQVCAYDYTRLHAMAAFASADEVRALYLAIRSKGTMMSECKPMPFPICVWVGQSDESSAELRLAWPGSQPADHAVVAGGLATDRMTARLDPGGNMHLAFYDYPFIGGDPKVRYLMIGP